MRHNKSTKHLLILKLCYGHFSANEWQRIFLCKKGNYSSLKFCARRGDHAYLVVWPPMSTFDFFWSRSHTVPKGLIRLLEYYNKLQAMYSQVQIAYKFFSQWGFSTQCINLRKLYLAEKLSDFKTANCVGITQKSTTWKNRNIYENWKMTKKLKCFLYTTYHLILPPLAKVIACNWSSILAMRICNRPMDI